MEWTNRESETERLRSEILRTPSWARAEQLERIIPQKDLWTPENLVRQNSIKERAMTEKNQPIRRYQMATLAALLLFVAATFQIADDKTLLRVVFFAAASCLSSLAGIYYEKEARTGSGIGQ
jgi:hypothetical protein